MPQMSPILWLYLMIFFSLVFILFNMLVYFNFSYKFNKMNNTLMKKTFQLNWKW